MILNYCAPCHDIEINKIKKFFDSNSIIFGVAGQDNVPYKRSKVTDKTVGKIFSGIEGQDNVAYDRTRRALEWRQHSILTTLT